MEFYPANISLMENIRRQNFHYDRESYLFRTGARFRGRCRDGVFYYRNIVMGEELFCLIFGHYISIIFYYTVNEFSAFIFLRGEYFGD
ncbi:hypothetical protein ES708_29947 [subsurface metagenome]